MNAAQIKMIAAGLRMIADAIEFDGPTLVDSKPKEAPKPKEAKPEPEVDQVTLEVIRDNLKAFSASKDGNRDLAKKLIQSFGVKTLGLLPQDKFNELYEKMIEQGMVQGEG